MVSPAVRLALSVVAVGGAFGGAAVVGDAVGPVQMEERGELEPEGAGEQASFTAGEKSAGTGGHQLEDPSGSTAPAGHDHAGHDDQDPAGDGGTAATSAGGVLISEDGYTLEPEATILSGKEGAELRFRISGPDSEVVHDFEQHHERELHLVLVGRDLSSYTHIHPLRDAEGTWSVPLPALEPGSYRAFADFVVAGGPALTLSTDLLIPGDVVVEDVPPPRSETMVEGGYFLTMTGVPAAGEPTEVAFALEHEDSPVRDLEPYLGELGHLVAIRSGDLAYVHAHPVEADSSGQDGTVPFELELPSAGSYRLFFEFAHQGEVRTADFTVEVGSPSPDADRTGSADSQDHDQRDEPDGPGGDELPQTHEHDRPGEHDHHGLSNRADREATNLEGA